MFDRWVWKPENDGSYSAYLACKEICELREGNQADPWLASIWSINVPPKVHYLLWFFVIS